jgi:hypothetical protein
MPAEGLADVGVFPCRKAGCLVTKNALSPRNRAIEVLLLFDYLNIIP